MVFIKHKLKNERGTALVEFAFAIIIFAAFMYGLFAVTWWGIGAQFLQDAAHDAAGKYAVTLDQAAAVQRARQHLGRWAYLFVNPGTVRISVWGEGDTAHAEVSAEPKFKRIYLYSLPQLRKTSSCVFEYRFRDPGEFN